jgi:rubrerythrin
MSIIRTPRSRRAFLTGAGTALSAGSIALLGGMSGITATRAFATDMSGDVTILNVALGLEHEAIAAYQVGAESGLLQKPVLDVAVLFQTHHKGHRDALIDTIKKMGGMPVEAKSNADYAKDLDAASLKDQTGVLKLAQRLEKGAANAYIGVIPSFEDKALAQVSARLAADESMHWAILTNALGEMLPAGALTFGA